MNRIYRAVTTSPAWSRTALVINYDEWGGFFDHVPPPTRAAAAGRRAPPATWTGRLGFRVPCLLVSPYARRGHVARRQYDHTSILRMIEARFGLAPLTVRDATANNLGRRAPAALEAVDAAVRRPGRAVRRRLPGPGARRRRPHPAVGHRARPRRRGPGSTGRASGTGLRELARSTGWPV